MTKKARVLTVLEEANNLIAEYKASANYEEYKDYYDVLIDKLRSNAESLPIQDTYKIFGYGSLLNKRSRKRTFDTISVEYGTVKGYQRIFNLSMAQGTCLNVRESEDSVVDGAICEITPSDMLNFLEREINYDVLMVTTEETEEEVFMVMAKDGATSVIPEDIGQPVQRTFPRLDYLQACYHGIYNLKKDNLFLDPKSTVMYEGTPISSFIETFSGQKVRNNPVLKYWSILDSNY